MGAHYVLSVYRLIPVFVAFTMPVAFGDCLFCSCSGNVNQGGIGADFSMMGDMWLSAEEIRCVFDDI